MPCANVNDKSQEIVFLGIDAGHQITLFHFEMLASLLAMVITNLTHQYSAIYSEILLPSTQHLRGKNCNSWISNKYNLYFYH